MSDELEDYGAFSRAELELKCGMLAAENREAMLHYRATTQRAQAYKDLFSRFIRDLAASEATTEPDTRALRPAAGGSGQLVQAPQEAPAPTGSSVRCRAPGSHTSNTPVYSARGGEHRGSIGSMPVRERPTQIRPRPYDHATCTPISYVSLSLTVSMSH